MVGPLRGLLGIAPDPRTNGDRFSSDQGRLGRDAPFSKAVLIASSLQCDPGSSLDGNNADQRNY
jgi:hypothetical protein